MSTLEPRALSPRHRLTRQSIGIGQIPYGTLPPRLENRNDTASVKRIIEIMEAYRGLHLSSEKAHPEPGTTVYYLSNRTGEIMVAREKPPRRISDDYIAALIGIPNIDVHECDACGAPMPVIIEYSCTLDGFYEMQWKTFCAGRSGCSHISTARQPATLSEHTLI